MVRRKTFGWICLVVLVGVQVFAVWTLFWFVPETLDWYMGQQSTTDFVIPKVLHGFLNLPYLFHNTPFVWFPAWAAVLGLAGLVLFLYRERWWPVCLVGGVAVAELAYLVTMVILTSRHVAQVAGG